MPRYELWKKTSLGQRNKLPDAEYFTPDLAMDAAKSMSKGFTTEHSYDWLTSSTEEVQVPNSIAVIVRDTDVRTLGWGIGGKWHAVKDNCGRCNNSGMDTQNYREFCRACKGASYKPKV